MSQEWLTFILGGKIKVFHITPYLTGDIGKAINETIEHLPDDAWICLRDFDTLFLLPQQGNWIEQIVESDPPFDLIGCSTNRLNSGYQLYGEERSEDPNILNHMQKAVHSFEQHKLTIEEVPVGTPLAGMFLLFRKSLWQEFKIEERSIQFDLILSEQLQEAGKRLGIARGIYIFHTYRLGAKDPRSAINHLLHCQDMSKIFQPKEKPNDS